VCPFCTSRTISFLCLQDSYDTTSLIPNSRTQAVIVSSFHVLVLIPYLFPPSSHPFLRPQFLPSIFSSFFSAPSSLPIVTLPPHRLLRLPRVRLLRLVLPVLRQLSRCKASPQKTHNQPNFFLPRWQVVGEVAEGRGGVGVRHIF
jgi:hypothetical protein